MNRVIIAAVAASALISTAVIAGPSAKFAATYSKNFGFESVAVIDDATEYEFVFDIDLGYTLATIKVPQDKELLVGLSANIGLTTDTSIKGKNGGSAKSLAFGEGSVGIWACPTGVDVPNTNPEDCVMAEPGWVVLNGRFQVLDATLGGVIESCSDGDMDGNIIISEDCEVTSEEIGLMLSTLSANHFNFVLPNLDQGEYDVVAVFQTIAAAEVFDVDQAVLADDETINVSASSFANAFIGKYMLTVQQVRAAEGGVIEVDIEEF